MKITVIAISKFQRYFPARSNQVDFLGTTLPEFLNWVKTEYGLDVAEHKNIKITRNSAMVKDFNVPLQDGDRIAFIPIVAGG
ncbi:MAG: MoaD/ThiS family protein [PVC group bacterium]